MIYLALLTLTPLVIVTAYIYYSEKECKEKKICPRCGTKLRFCGTLENKIVYICYGCEYLLKVARDKAD